MLRRMTITVALVILGTLSAGVLRAADQPSQAPSAEKQESATEKVGRATNTAAEKMERAAATASKELSDSWITLKTKLSLFADERVSGTDVHVTTQQGVIVLTGKVGTEEARLAAEETAAKIDGAKKVENHLVVVPKAAHQAVDRQDDLSTGSNSTSSAQGSRTRIPSSRRSTGGSESHSALADRTPAEVAAAWTSGALGPPETSLPDRSHGRWLRPSRELH